MLIYACLCVFLSISLSQLLVLLLVLRWVEEDGSLCYCAIVRCAVRGAPTPTPRHYWRSHPPIPLPPNLPLFFPVSCHSFIFCFLFACDQFQCSANATNAYPCCHCSPEQHCAAAAASNCCSALLQLIWCWCSVAMRGVWLLCWLVVSACSFH